MKQCFACGRKLGKTPYTVDTRDDQTVAVGSECYKLVKAAGENGYQPPKGGPRLWLLDFPTLMSADGWRHVGRPRCFDPKVTGP